LPGLSSRTSNLHLGKRIRGPRKISEYSRNFGEIFCSFHLGAR
jgi:hypothetical protein